MITPIRVLVVDDSAFMRYTITKHLEADDEISVIGTARDGFDALDKIAALTPDIVTLDVEMPGMDGLTALKHIMSDCPTPVIMLSSLTKRGARTTIQALIGGAVDFVPKPIANTDIQIVISELVIKIKATTRGSSFARKQSFLHKARSSSFNPAVPETGGIQPFRSDDPVIVIGASTGGPFALKQVLSNLPADLTAAVVIVQHMPPNFTYSLAQRLNQISPLIVQEAADGDRLARGLALIAPGDYHLYFDHRSRVTLDQGPRRNYVRPAIDVTMASAVAHYHSAVIGVILTGMGSDGKQGASLIKAADGKVIAEHESTSVVYGMPRSVVEANLADQVVPLQDVSVTILEMVDIWKRRNTVLSSAKS